MIFVIFVKGLLFSVICTIANVNYNLVCLFVLLYLWDLIRGSYNAIDAN